MDSFKLTSLEDLPKLEDFSNKESESLFEE